MLARRLAVRSAIALGLEARIPSLPLALLATALLAGGAPLAAASPEKEVVVTNGEANPVPVQSVGTATVRVDPLAGPVDVEDRVLGPLNVTSAPSDDIIIPEGHAAGWAELPAAPPGHVRVWQQISGLIFVPHGQVPDVVLWIQGQLKPTLYWLTVRRVRQHPQTDTYQFNEQVTVYQKGGELAAGGEEASLYLSTAGYAHMQWSISGRLQPCRTPTCG